MDNTLDNIPEICQRILLQLWELRFMGIRPGDRTTIQNVMLAEGHLTEAAEQAQEKLPFATRFALKRAGKEEWQAAAEKDEEVRHCYQLYLVRNIVTVLLADLQPPNDSPPNLTLVKRRS